MKTDNLVPMTQMTRTMMFISVTIDDLWPTFNFYSWLKITETYKKILLDKPHKRAGDMFVSFELSYHQLWHLPLYWMLYICYVNIENQNGNNTFLTCAKKNRIWIKFTVLANLLQLFKIDDANGGAVYWWSYFAWNAWNNPKHWKNSIQPTLSFVKTQLLNR